MQQPDKLIPINVWLAGRSYRIRIAANEEEAVRKAVKAADNQIAELRNNYAGKDDQDFVAMCLLMYAANGATDGSGSPFAQQELSAILSKINSLLEE